jgi:6-phosphogluconolactonase
MPNIKTCADPAAVAKKFAHDFAQWIQSQPDGVKPLTVALSGGSTPQILFRLWAEQWSGKIPWERIQFYWGDERCVCPADPESNYGVAKKLLLDKIEIPEDNVHRVHGESDPNEERSRYEREIRSNLSVDEHSIPKFDLVILGMGDDGHTASIFPHQMQFMNSERVTEVASHPATDQKRITLTGSVLNAAHRVAFLITGQGKADVLAQVINHTGDFESYPAALINAQEVTFYVDDAAASQLKLS